MSVHTAEQAHALLMLILDTETCNAYNLKSPPYGNDRPVVDITPLLGADGPKMIDKFLTWTTTGKHESNYTIVDW